MSVRLLSIGRATPHGSIAQHDALRMARELAPAGVPETVLERIHRACGIETRHASIIDPLHGGQTLRAHDSGPNGPTTSQRIDRYAAAAAPLAIEASSLALRNAAITPDRVTHLICASCTGFTAPGVDQALVWGLGLRKDIGRTVIGFMGCHAAINSLRVAHDAVRADPRAVALVCCVELCSLHMQFTDRTDRLIANALFADGAAAAVVAQSDDPTAPAIRRVASSLIPESGELMGWCIGDHGFEMTLSPRVPEVLARTAGPWVDGVLSATGLTREQIGGWAIHPGGPKIIDSVASALNLAEDSVRESRDVLRKFGNMSSPTVLFILDELSRAKRPRPWVAMAFGPGLAAEMIVLD